MAVLGNTRGATAGGGDPPPPRQRLPLAISYLRILLRAPESLALLSYVLFLQPAWQTDPPPWPSCYSPAPGGKTSEGEAVRRSRGPRPAEALRPAAGSARGPGTPACDCYSSAPTHRLLRAGPRCPGPGQGLFVAWVSEQRGRRAPARGRTQRCRPSQRPGHPRRPGSRRCDGSQASYTRFTYILGNMENIKQGSLRREN